MGIEVVLIQGHQVVPRSSSGAKRGDRFGEQSRREDEVRRLESSRPGVPADKSALQFLETRALMVPERQSQGFQDRRNEFIIGVGRSNVVRINGCPRMEREEPTREILIDSMYTTERVVHDAEL